MTVQHRPHNRAPRAGPAAGLRRRCLAGLGAVVTGLLARPAGSSLLAAAMLPSAARAAADTPGAPALGTVLELPAVRLLDGSELPASHWKGKVVVIELWATWCPFCAKQNPYLDALHRAHLGHGLEVIALSIDRDPETARRYVVERDYAFHVAMFDDEWQAAIGRPRGLPIIWVVDRDGRLARLEIGEQFPEDIAEFAQLL